MSRIVDTYNRLTPPEEQTLYNYWLELSQHETPETILKCFREMFVDGYGYADAQVWQALLTTISTRSRSQDFQFVLNRCCYILINRWLLHPRYQHAIPELVELLNTVPPAGSISRRHTVHLRSLVHDFTQTEQYAALQRLAEFARDHSDPFVRTQPLGSFIRRYPYLYEHCLLLETSEAEQRRTIRDIQRQAQKQFELDLSRYVMRRRVQGVASQAEAVPNPTLLKDDDLSEAVRQFSGKVVENTATQKDWAQKFLTYSRQTPNYRVFKQDLFEYLVQGLPRSYGDRQFFERLQTHLMETMPDCDGQELTEFLLLRTCSRLLNFLVVEGLHNPNHIIFVDLISNLGTILTINLLLRVVLLCTKIKGHLEKRFAILFQHYESQPCDRELHWLLEALETLNVAFATNFGSVRVAQFCYATNPART